MNENNKAPPTVYSIWLPFWCLDLNKIRNVCTERQDDDDGMTHIRDAAPTQLKLEHIKENIWLCELNK